MNPQPNSYASPEECPAPSVQLPLDDAQPSSASDFPCPPPHETGKRREIMMTNRELSEFCQTVHQAGTAYLNAEVTEADVESFLALANSPLPPLPAYLQAKVDVMPDLLPGTAGRLALFRESREHERSEAGEPVRLPMRSAASLRAAMHSDSFCQGRKQEMNDGAHFLKQAGCRILVVSGEPGIGKTTVAHAIAHRFADVHANVRMLPPSAIRFFDCVGLGTQRELSDLLFSQIFDRARATLPEGIERRLEVLGHCLTSYLSGLSTALWIFDGLDEYLQAVNKRDEQISLTAKLFKTCAQVATNLKVIVTVRSNLEGSKLHQLLEKHFHLCNIQLSLRKDLLPKVESTPPCERNVETAGSHPLADLMIEAIGKRATASPPQQISLLHHSEDCPAVLLNQACETSWNALEPADQRCLKICKELPGGIWIKENCSDDRKTDYIHWREVFVEESWQQRLAQLSELGWLTVRKDSSEIFGQSCLYRLRPALNVFLEKQTARAEYLSINHRLIYFWAMNLKRWSHAIAGRLTDLVEPTLPFAPNKQKNLLIEENARYLIDVSRLNWLLAYRRISRCAKARDRVALHYFYLRGSICYCRMVGSLTLFEGLVEKGLKEIKRFIADDEAKPWRRLAHAMYLASCYDMRGRTLRRLGKLSGAEESLGDAADLLRLLPQKCHRIRHKLAWTLTELGRVLQDTGHWREAGRALEEAIDIRRGLLDQLEQSIMSRYTPDRIGKPDAPADHVLEKKRNQQLRYLATSLNIYGNVLNERSEWIKAEAVHHDALSIREGLEESQSYYFQRYIAHCLNDYANSLYYQGRFMDALPFYLKALTIREELVPNPENGLGQYVARTCNNIGNTYRALGHWPEARHYLERAVSIYRACIVGNPARFNNMLARSLTNLGRVYYHQGLLREAVTIVEEAERLHLAAADTVVTPFKWVETCNLLASLYLELVDSKYALKALDRATKLLEQGDRVCPISHAWHQAFTLNARGRVLLHSADPADWKKAEGFLRSSEKLRVKLQSKVDVHTILDLPIAENWHDLGWACHRLGKFNDAEIYFQDALQLRRQLTTQRPHYIDRLVARTATKLADLYMDMGRHEEAYALYENAQTILHRLHGVNPRGFTKELQHASESLEKLSKLMEREMETAD